MELGKYTQVVLWSYAGSVVMILGLVTFSLWQAAKMRRALKDVEDRQGRSNG